VANDLGSSRAWRTIRDSPAPLFRTPRGDPRTALKRLLNVPLHIFGRSQRYFNLLLLDTLGAVLSQLCALQDRIERPTGLASRVERLEHQVREGVRLAEWESEIVFEGAWRSIPLAGDRTGWLAEGGDGAALSVDFEGTDLVVFFWSDAASGRAFVEVDGVGRYVELYADVPGLKQLHVSDLPPGRHHLRIRGSKVADRRSAGTRIVFHKAIGCRRCETVPDVPPADFHFTRHPDRFGVIYTTPAHMTAAERVTLYSLVFGLRPQRCLEIGTFHGGSSLVIVAALDDLGAGELVCVDPSPAVAPEDRARMAHRAHLIERASPAALGEAMAVAGGHFDFALIDGDHERTSVVRDIEGVLDVLAPNAHVLLHDAHYLGVSDAIEEMMRRHPDRLVDCGMLSTEQVKEDRSVDGRPVTWGGLRLLRHRGDAGLY
jgi:predicted O-methyltransferase YrrM